MGTRPSPFNAVRSTHLAEEIVRGDNLDPRNPLRWNGICLNIPGNPNYNPSLSWVSKVWKEGDNVFVANDFFAYVDDVRITALTQEGCRATTRRVLSMFQKLGIQDAPRKRRNLSKGGNPWAGSVINASRDEIAVSVSKEKWRKGKDILESLISQYLNKKDSEDIWLDFKKLEQDRGFLVHLSMTYPDLVPYLKGIHLTLDSWRKDRKNDGWKVQGEDEWIQFLRERNYTKVDKSNWKKFAEDFKGDSHLQAPTKTVAAQTITCHFGSGKVSAKNVEGEKL